MKINILTRISPKDPATGPKQGSQSLYPWAQAKDILHCCWKCGGVFAVGVALGIQALIASVREEAGDLTGIVQVTNVVTWGSHNHCRGFSKCIYSRRNKRAVG